MNHEVYRNGVLIHTEEVPDEPPTVDERLAALADVLAEKQIITPGELDERAATRRSGDASPGDDPKADATMRDH